MSDTHVLIVGAGPTGLAMAVSLAQYGISCRIIDKKTELTQTSNALAVHSRTAEVFADLGVIDQALQHGKKLRGFNLYANQEKLFHADFADIPSQFNYVLALPQSQTEKVLAEKLEEYNIQVEYDKTLTNVTQDSQKITATITAANNNTETIDADYLIACDGGHSHIRQQLGINFTGEQLPQHFVMTDCDISSELSTDEMHAFLAKQGPVGLIPVGKTNYRLFFEVSQDEKLKDEKQPTFADFERLVDERLGGVVTIRNPSWISAFWISAKHIERYQDNRIFFAGDAAHVHSPAGGQGMNTGIQDAYNLAWKLAFVIKHTFNENFLASYEAERLPVAKHVLNASTDGTKMMSTSNPILQKIRNLAVKTLSHFDSVQQKLLLQLSELDVHYEDNQWLAEDLRESSNAFRNGIAPGDRAANPQLNGAYLYEKFAKQQYNCLLFPDDNTDLSSLATKIMQNYPGLINVIMLDNDLDYEKQARKAYHVDRNCLLLVRPDYYVGFRSVPASFDALEQYISTLQTQD